MLLWNFRLLNEAQGSLLDDEALVNTLQNSKMTSTEVEEQLVISEDTEIKIDAAREVRCTVGFTVCIFLYPSLIYIPTPHFTIKIKIFVFQNSLE